MTLFEAVKQTVTARQAAERYGFPATRSCKINCPFHDDRNPSMKVDKRFHCFGCGADGDVIDFASKLFGLPAKAAAEKLAADFQISYDNSKPIPPSTEKESKEYKHRNPEAKCFRVLSDYLHLLRLWERVYAPEPEDETWHPLFVEALQKKEHIEYLLDELLYEHGERREVLTKEYGEDVIKVEQRLSELRTGTSRHSEDTGTEPTLPDP